MAAEQFLLCLKRFIAIRENPKQIISDNASQFKVVRSTVEEAWQLSTTSPDTQSYLANEGIKWSSIIKLAPGWVVIGLVKQSLRNRIGNICRTMVQLETTVKEVEAVLNSRSLVYVGASFSTEFTLIPGDFLSLSPKTGVPSLAEEDQQDPDFLTEMSSSQRLIGMWRKGQKYLGMFWKLWFDEYVLSLRERTQKHLRASCCNGQLYLCKIEKNRFSENLSGRRCLLTCFKTVTLRLFGFLFSSPDRLLYFAPKRAKVGPEITLFAKAGKPKCVAGKANPYYYNIMF